ncbi:sulfotransferase [Phycicoccus sonneratiae]|uniref:Sulfotransferase n=1 Tax=Phycicoccus sonneratiae TaxID=2807628 RepID=A0ABS2CSJ1_9MICO|nr:sulfotransferase [Phycicoccus sonneraticus]MBM6402084.1 sulfotransferase [Phycicoccus sonneraticus]
MSTQTREETTVSLVPHRRTPVLVTGMPRSGTTWLARLLALAPGGALAGREPMNTRGRQYALAGSIDGWTRLEEPTSAQSRALRRAFTATTPFVYSRYGVRRWAAPLPWSTLVVKDPFAMLSVPAVQAVTGARPVLLHRHPGAMLVSYRRMGWLPDLDEIEPIVRRYEARRDPTDPAVPALPASTDAAGAVAMGWFWSALYAMAVADLRRSSGTLVVAHEALATDVAACRRLHDALGLTWGPAAEAEVGREGSGEVSAERLHNFDRAPADAATAWRGRLDAREVAEIEDVTAEVRHLVDEAGTGQGGCS